MPALLDHSQKRELDSNHASVVIGTLLGTWVGKIIDISNCFPMTLKVAPRSKKDERESELGEEVGAEASWKKKYEKEID